MPGPYSSAVKRAKGKIAGLAGELQHQAVRETEGRPGAEKIERRLHGVGILQSQVLVIEQHFDGSDKAGSNVMSRTRGVRRGLGRPPHIWLRLAALLHLGE
jgi:hypothetical protein